MSYHFPDFRGSDWGRRLGTEDRPGLKQLSCVLGFVQDSSNSPSRQLLSLLEPPKPSSQAGGVRPLAPPAPTRISPSPPSHRHLHHLSSTQSIFAACQHLLR